MSFLPPQPGTWQCLRQLPMTSCIFSRPRGALLMEADSRAVAELWQQCLQTWMRKQQPCPLSGSGRPLFCHSGSHPLSFLKVLTTDRRAALNDDERCL